MPGSWPEPFGLVAIEALACGTPVVARRVGGLEEIIRDGVDGFFGDDVTEMAFLVEAVSGLDREAIRASVVDRFSATRMADGYEALYARMLGLADEGEGEDEGDDGGEDRTDMDGRNAPNLVALSAGLGGRPADEARSEATSA